jgi:hypothetical protein
MQEVTDMKESITLPDGREMSWDEFTALSEAEQNAILNPGKPRKSTRHAQTSGDGDSAFGNKELLPRIRAAAERNKLTEDDLLAFIKIMHDIFFPPEPQGRRVCAAPAPPKQRGHGEAFSPKAVMTPAGRFESIAAATRFYNVDGGRIRAWIRNGKEGFYFL